MPLRSLAIILAAPPLAVAVAAVTLLAAAAGAVATSTATAQVDPTVSVDAKIDDDGDTAPDNSGTSVGAIDACVEMSEGSTLEVDVAIQDVTDLAGFQNNLLYNQSVLNVQAVDYNLLLASAGASVLDFGSDTPDSDGDFFMSAAIFDLAGTLGASGSGVLARVTLQAVGAGTSQLDVTGVKLSDPDGNAILPVDSDNFYIGPVNDAAVVVEGSCADSDGDTVLDGSDNCPSWPNPSQQLPVWPIPPGDDDCDGFSTADENHFGTDAEDPCPDDSSHDAWGPDFDMSRQVDIIDVLSFSGVILEEPTASPEALRHDLIPSEFVDIADVLVLADFILESCTNP